MLGLDDAKLLSTALAEVAAEDVSRDLAYAERIRRAYHEAYHELLQLRATRPLRARPAGRAPMLIPIASLEEIQFDPYAPPNPYLLLRLYGPEQLRAALRVYTLAKLKQALEPVVQRNPGVKPQSKARKDAVIDFIVGHVAGPGY
jgi:hypothetical protein